MYFAGLVLWALVVFQAKHFILDAVIEPNYRLRAGAGIVRPGWAIWALLHATGSLPAILLVASSVYWVAGIFVAEFILVYLLAWAREILTAVNIPQRTVSGVEQFLHQLFYLGVVAIAL